ncbi:MAG: toll/interleukin-1 receptor domain-containing protein [Anaerolineaceae bacterium]|nr:toll/interleukin-1 receptor domain-containing protein [Anaerolineaceae bacterium]
MLILTSIPADTSLADRLHTDLQAAGYEFTETIQKGAILIAVFSHATSKDARFAETIIQATDAGLHIIPIMADDVTLPDLVDHLAPFDFSQSYDITALKTRIEQLARPDARPPLKVRTPAVRASNRRFGYVLAALAVIWFILGIVLVGGFGIQAPLEEFNTVSTLEFATVQVYLNRNQPRTTADAKNFISTVEAAPTAQRPLLIATATALVETPVETPEG